MSVLRFETNVSATFALKYENGREVEGLSGPQFMYTTTAGDTFYLNPPVAARLQALGYAPGELIVACKREVKKSRGKGIEWEFKFADAAEPPASEPATAARPSKVAAAVAAAPAQPAISKQQPAQSESSAPPVVHTSLSRVMSACLIAAVDSLITAEHYALGKKFELHFNEEDVRCVANSFYIGLQKDFPVSTTAAPVERVNGGGASWRQ